MDIVKNSNGQSILNVYSTNLSDLLSVYFRISTILFLRDH